MTFKLPAFCGKTPICPGLPLVSSEQSLRIIWDAVSRAWSPKNVCWIKRNAQLLGCTFFLLNYKIGPSIVYSTYVSHIQQVPVTHMRFSFHSYDNYFFLTLFIIIFTFWLDVSMAFLRFIWYACFERRNSKMYIPFNKNRSEWILKCKVYLTKK